MASRGDGDHAHGSAPEPATEPAPDRGARRRGGTREKMVRTAADLLSTGGVAGTTVDRVLAVSGTPRGSVYHHFPDGRGQLLVEAVGYAGAYVERSIREAPRASDALDSFVAFWRARLESTDFRAGCPLLAATVDDGPGGPDAREMQLVAADYLERWEVALAGRLEDAGLAAAPARELAEQSLSLLEGAVAMSRARRDMGPLDSAAAAISVLFRAAVARN